MVICREAWGARAIDGELEPHVIERLTIHHTGVVLDDNTQAPGRARRHQQFHQLERGWPDLAYHYLIDAHGHVYEGRPVGTVGDTGTDYDPTGHFLVACEGDFDRQPVPEAQLLALIDLLAWASAEFAVDPATIGGHRDWAATSCPGDNLYALIEAGDIERAVRERIDAGGVSLTMVCGTAGVEIVAAIESGTDVPD
jgi:hypothetical protein